MVSRRRHLGVVFALVVVLVGLGAMGVWQSPKERRPLAEKDLGDGRIFQIEAVSFGTSHQAGVGAPFVERFGSWMPAQLREYLQPKVPKSSISRSKPVLVVWVTALSATYRTNVDCQGVRVELRDAEGNVYSDNQPNWFGYKNFWRVGHVFEVFPRHEPELKVTVATWRGSSSVTFTVPNPGMTQPKDWKAEPPPLRKREGEYEVVLQGVTMKTNRGEYWKAASAYWEPAFELWKAGKEVEEGWDLEWAAEDAWGNRGKELGLTKPVLKFFATYYPSGTNNEATVLVANTPAAPIGSGSNQWWNVKAQVETNKVEILGLFPAGVYTFSDGEYLTNPPTKFGPTQGGAPSGWVSSSRRTPLRVEEYHGHYSDVPVIYVRVSDPKSSQRIALRVRDVETRKIYLAKPEPEGSAARIAPFLVKVPKEVQSVSAELVLLRPVSAEFLVETKR
jgi:hypothetical protein